MMGAFRQTMIGHLTGTSIALQAPSQCQHTNTILPTSDNASMCRVDWEERELLRATPKKLEAEKAELQTAVLHSSECSTRPGTARAPLSESSFNDRQEISQPSTQRHAISGTSSHPACDINLPLTEREFEMVKLFNIRTATVF